MTDRELLELSAKAAGYGALLPMPMSRTETVYVVEEFDGGPLKPWNPIGDLAQAIRMALQLRIGMDLAGRHPAAVFFHPRRQVFVRYQENQDDDGWEPAVCRAFTRAAAEIGRCLP